VAIKNSVYVLPRTDQAAEHFQWIVREVEASGGEASVCEAAFVSGLSDGQIEALFRAAREADYAAVSEEAQELLRRTPGARAADTPGPAEHEAALARLRRRLNEIGAVDFFGAPARPVAEAAIERVEARIRPPKQRAGRSARGGESRRKPARTWVTRRGVHVDRIASAWLIRRFIDPRARFRFVEDRGYQPRPGEVRFDMFEAEYTHEGDRCTFETLVARFQLDEPGLRALAEMVHDVDLADGKFARPETAGFERLIDGITRTQVDDADRIAQGAALLDGFYRSFQSEVAPARRRPVRSK